MAHQIDFSNGRANMAYVGQTPWHKLGHELQRGASIEAWRSAAGLDWSINAGQLAFNANGTLTAADELNRVCLYRSDTHAPLAIVSDAFKVVQPAEILEFFRDLVGVGGFHLHTAGSMFGGKKIWALAETGLAADIAKQDRMKAYLLLATACDGSLATTISFTGTRVVCNNTLTVALREGDTTRDFIKVPHSTTFNHAKVKRELGLAANTWETFITQARELAKVKLTDAKALAVLREAVADADDDDAVTQLDMQKFAALPQPSRIMELFNGQAIGSELAGSRGTAWGLVNAVTQFFDHETASRSDDARMQSAWFGRGQLVKAYTFDRAVELI